MSYTNPSTPMDYTNNDFRAIFPELLEVVKQLTSKWDPTISNESDPGVILLKLNAIIGDKNNYNIDKNILEAFPETLTQEVSARRLYKQLGYNMKWYVTSETQVAFKYIGDVSSLPTTGWSMRLPAYTTMITDENSEVVYTLIEDVILTRDQLLNTGAAVQGIYSSIKVGGSEKLTYSNLDENNRIYFDDYNVPQNAIFLKSELNGVSHIWQRVDNLASIAAFDSQYYYEFGVDPQTNSCYIEFPQNAADLIGEFFTVGYVLSAGSQGRVTANVLSQFYSDATVYVRENSLYNEEEQALEADTVLVTNPSASTAGTDPETVEEAARGYKKVVGTFDTLVTVRDYMNAVFNSGLVSNAQVSDRYSDLQSSYTVVTPADEGYTTRRFVDTIDDTPAMNAYELKLYLLGNNGQVFSVDTFNNTFDFMQGYARRDAVINALDNTKAISHDYVDFIEKLPVLFRNLYSLRIRYIAKSRLDASKVNEIKSSIITNLLQALNAHQVDFGVALNYDYLSSIVKSSDERIQTVILEDPTYTTYASYLEPRSEGSGWTLKSVPVSKFDNDPFVISYSNSVDAPPESTEYTNLTDKSKYLFINKDYNSVYVWTGTAFELYSSAEQMRMLREFVITRNIFAGVTPAYIRDDRFSYELNRNVMAEEAQVDRISTSLNITFNRPEPQRASDYLLRANETIRILGPEIVEKINYSTSTKFALKLNTDSRAVLQTFTDTTYTAFQSSYLGDTYRGPELYSNKDRFTYNGEEFVIPNWNDDGVLHQVEVGGLTYYNITESVTAEYGYSAEEHDTWFKPFLEAWKFGDIHVGTISEVVSIAANTTVQLKADEYIVFMTQTQEGETAPYTYFYYPGTNDSSSPIIKPSFDIMISPEVPSVIASTPFISGEGYIPYGSETYNFIQNEMFNEYDLTGSRSISICGLAEATYTDGSIYFITNTLNDDGSKYLLKVNNNNGEYILESDEYFLHVSASGAAYEVLGPGTLIKFKNIPEDLSVTKISMSLVLMNGLDAFLEHVLPVKNYGSIYVRQQQINNFAADDLISWRDSQASLALNSETYTQLDVSKLWYTTSAGDSGSFGAIKLNDPSITWLAKSILNISMSKYDPQIISDFEDGSVQVKQTMKLKYQGNTHTIPQRPLGEDISTIDLYVTSSHPVDKVGGSNIEVAYTSLVDGASLPISVQVYSLADRYVSKPPVWDLVNEFGYIEPDQNSVNLDSIIYPSEWKVPTLDRKTGGYLIEFTLEASYPESVTFSVSGYVSQAVTTESLPIQGEYRVHDNGFSYRYNLPQGKTSFYCLYYYHQDTGFPWPDGGEDGSLLSMELDIQNPEGLYLDDSNCVLKLTPKTFYYYDFNTALQEHLPDVTTMCEIIDLLHENIPEAVGKFQWTYQPEDGYILDPLAPTSFFDTLHVFNKYCIPQLRASFNAVNVNDSLIQIVNNK